MAGKDDAKRFGKGRAREGNNLSSKGFSFSHYKYFSLYIPSLLTNRVKKYPYLFPQREKMIQKGLEKEEREKEITFPQKVFLSRIE